MYFAVENATSLLRSFRLVRFCGDSLIVKDDLEIEEMRVVPTVRWPAASRGGEAFQFRPKLLTILDYPSDLENNLANLVRAKISALGTYVPPRLLTNADLEKMVETTNDWIIERTGIRQRHIVDKGVATSDLAIEAAKSALQQRGIPASEVEAIFVGT